MEKYIRAIQLSPKRTGSTFLQNAINSHSDIIGIDEIFVNVCRKSSYRKSGFIPYVRPENPHKNPKSYLEKYIYKSYQNKSTIFKLMYNQINYHSGLMDYIVNNRIPIIHLMRKNLVKQVISGMTAATTKHNPVSISGEELFKSVKEAKRLNIYWAKKLKNQIKLTLYYEDIIGRTEGDKTYVSPNVNIALCNLFKIPQVQLFAKTKKKNKEDLSVYLPNIENIMNKFKGTEFEWMLKGE